jgi:crossover junction endodeoxyribonuclease RusA
VVDPRHDRHRVDRGGDVQQVTLILPYPLSANRYWRSIVISGQARTLISREAKAYKAEVAQLCKSAGVAAPIAGRVQIDVQLYPRRPLDWQKRQRQLGATWDDGVLCIDLDNANKVLLDSLKDIAIEDDKRVRVLHSERMEPDDGGARVVVTITALETEVVQAGLFAEATA